MIVLGCDPSLTGFGWAVRDTSRSGPEQVIGSGRIRTSSSEMDIDRFRRHHRELGRVIDVFDPDYAGVEKALVGGISPGQGSQVANMYALFIQVWRQLRTNRVPFCNIVPPHLEYLAGGLLGYKIKGDKDAKVEAAKIAMGGGYPGDGDPHHDVADAYLEAYFASRFKMCLEGDLPETELIEEEQEKFFGSSAKRSGKVTRDGFAFKEGEKHFAFQDESYDRLFEDEPVLFDLDW